MFYAIQNDSFTESTDYYSYAHDCYERNKIYDKKWCCQHLTKNNYRSFMLGTRERVYWWAHFLCSLCSLVWLYDYYKYAMMRERLKHTEVDVSNSSAFCVSALVTPIVASVKCAHKIRYNLYKFNFNVRLAGCASFNFNSTKYHLRCWFHPKCE